MAKYYKGSLIFTKDVKGYEYNIYVYSGKILDFSSKDFRKRYKHLPSKSRDVLERFFGYYNTLDKNTLKQGNDIIYEMYKDLSYQDKYHSNDQLDVIFEIMEDDNGNQYGKELLTGMLFPIINKVEIKKKIYADSEIFIANKEHPKPDELFWCAHVNQTYREYKNDGGYKIYVENKNWERGGYFWTYSSADCAWHTKNDGLYYKIDGHKIVLNFNFTFPFSNLARGECLIENQGNANELEINAYKEKHQDRKRLFHKIEHPFKDAVIRYSQMNVFEGPIVPKKISGVPKRVEKMDEDQVMSQIEFLLIKLKNHHQELYERYQKEYASLLSNNSSLQVMPINVALNRLLSKIEFALEFNKGNGTSITEFLENKKHEYLEKLYNGDTAKTNITIQEIDKIMELFLKVQDEYDLLTRRKVIRNIALLYIFELYENKDDLINIDLKNSYINDNIMTIIVCLNSLYELGLMESDLIIDFGNDLKLTDILKIISSMTFKNIDQYDVMELCKRI